MKQILLMLALASTGQLALTQAQPPASPPADWGPVSINLESIPYPYPVQFLKRNIMGQDVRVAFMDAAPAGPANGRAVVLLHGGSYYGWYWGETMRALAGEGYRVIAVDRLGWGRSSKPVLPYSPGLHSANIKAILDHLGVEQVAIGGHSMGGRMASHFAYVYPETVTHMFMVNPIGLGDPSRARPYRDPASSGEVESDLQQVYERELALEMRRVAEWKPEHLEHVRIRYGYALSGEYPRLNLVRALNGNITEQPIRAYFPQINVPALLVGGEEDGPDYPDLSRAAVDLLPNGELELFPGIGHNPHLEAPELLNAAIIRFIGRGT